MAITFRSVASAASVTCGKPSGTVEGDLLVSFHPGAPDELAITPPSGWTLIDRADLAGSSNIVGAAYWKIAGSSEPSDYTWTAPGAGFFASAILAYSGTHPTTPIGPSTNNTGETNPRTALSVTTPDDNCVIVALLAGLNDMSTPASGMTLRTNIAGVDSLQVYDEAIATAGATGNRTDTAASNTGWVSVMVAIRPAASGEDDLGTADNIASATSVGAPAITQLHALTATGISSASTVGTPALTQLHELAADDISASPTVGTPALTESHALTADDISTTPAVGSPALTQTHSLAADDVAAEPAVGAPALSQLHALAADGVSSATSVGEPTLSENGVLAPVDISAQPTVGAPALTQHHELTAEDISCETFVGEPSGANLGGRLVNRYRRASRRRPMETEFPPVITDSPPPPSDPYRPLAKPVAETPRGLLSREQQRLSEIQGRIERSVSGRIYSERRLQELTRLQARVTALRREVEEAHEAELDREEEEVVLRWIEEEDAAVRRHVKQLLALLEEDEREA